MEPREGLHAWNVVAVVSVAVLGVIAVLLWGEILRQVLS
jgi:hypothetical protein